MVGDRLRVGVVGCGDVAHRHYFPALERFAGLVEIVGCCDSRPEAARMAARRARGWSAGARSYTDVDRLLAGARPDALFNLTPAPLHGAITARALDAGVHVYSEKPIAGSVAEADGLIAKAAEKSLLLLCAPASAATRRVRWLAEIVASGRYGPLTLAVAQQANLGPAAWREYTGDPTVFYGPAVGPVFDHGIYRLHEMTALMGPVRRVQAMGSIAIPRRLVRAGPLAGQVIEVLAPDHVLMSLEFAGGGIGQLLSSFAVPGSQSPWLELHFAHATISYAGNQYDPDAPASLHVDDEGTLGLDGWTQGLRPPPPGDDVPVIEAGVAHFVGCLRGDEEPLATAQHARHVLEVILAAYESIRDGRSHELLTTF